MDNKYDFKGENLYHILGVEDAATEKDIRNSYRKLALKWHPDKNPDKKEEAERMFVKLGKALEILCDKSARAAYDAVLKQKKEKAKRDEQLDDKRRKMKEKLEKNEQAAKEMQEKKISEFRKDREEEYLQKEIERLRREGSKLLEEEMNFINEQLRQEKKRAKEQENEKGEKKEAEVKPPRLKVAWTSKLDEEIAQQDKREQYREMYLKSLLEKYGEIELFIVSSNKKSTAIVEYKTIKSALNCFSNENHLKETYSITLKWLGPELNQAKQQEIQQSKAQPSQTPQAKVVESETNEDENLESLSFEDLELAVLKKLKKK